MSVIVTGGAGYIGSHIVEQLIKKRKKVIILDNLVTGHKRLINQKATFIKGDIKDKKTLNKIIKNYNVDTIFHLAACLNINEAENNKIKYKMNNILGTKNLIMLCKNSDIKNFIFSSSCSVYGSVEGRVNEKRKLNPQSYYAYTKFKGEELIKKYSKKFGYRYGILRYFNVAGASDSGKIGEIESSHDHLIKNISIESLKKNPNINIYGKDYPTKDGTCIRDYIHVTDLAIIHLKGLEYLNNLKKSFVVNCGYGKGYSVQEVVNIFKKINKKLTINYKKRRVGDVAQIYSNTTKFNKIFKWKPKNNNLKKIIESSITWERKLKFL
jgi:UDP-glucose 4-epimerase|tara:strand:+ start:781 stop:1755 length:975 start_codon:yes stop_codon:yes gene_type:complete